MHIVEETDCIMQSMLIKCTTKYNFAEFLVTFNSVYVPVKEYCYSYDTNSARI